MKQSLGLIAMMGAAMAGGAARESQVTKATFKPNYLNLPKHEKHRLTSREKFPQTKPTQGNRTEESMSKPLDIGPITRECSNPKYSSCATASLADLDWKNWFQDYGYIHVRKFNRKEPLEGETWHRVFPKRIAGRVYQRISVKGGKPHWLHDKIKDSRRRA